VAIPIVAHVEIQKWQNMKIGVSHSWR